MIKNICHGCIYHERCMAYRYKNIKTKFMKKVAIKENKDGNKVIYVEKCDKFIKRFFKYVPERLSDLKK